MKLQVKKLDTRATVLDYAHPGDAGLNVHALDNCTVPARGRVVIGTGLAFAIPDGYVGLVWDRSGLAAKEGIHHMAGVIDAGYRGEFKVVLYNTTDQDYLIKAGDKIAQLLVQPVASVEIVEVVELDETSRGAGGFGSTGR